MVVAVVAGVMTLAGLLIARNLRYKALATLNRSYAPVVMFVLCVLLVCDLIAGNGVYHRMQVDLMLALIPMSLLTNAFISSLQKKIVISSSCVLSGILSIYYVICFLDAGTLPTSHVLRIMTVLAALLYVVLLVLCLWWKLRNIHALMQTGSVWTVLCLSVDAIYSTLLLLLMIIYAALATVPVVCIIVDILMLVMICALVARMICDSVFVIFRRHERRIVESMRISPVESMPSAPGEENVYKELFERIQEYFDEEKPFLNGNLTINDIVTKVFSNKVYISRAIVQCTGRNFCQYVNYHRIMYAMECFRQNTELKISELWPLCGFNTIVSFNMAFRLFMDENPSEWCRKEKIRLSKKKK